MKNIGWWFQPIWISQPRIYITLQPWNLTWNLKRSPYKREFLLETIIFRFHVKFRGCTFPPILSHSENRKRTPSQPGALVLSKIHLLLCHTQNFIVVIWVFPKMVGYHPKSSILNRVFHYKPETPIYHHQLINPHQWYFATTSWDWEYNSSSSSCRLAKELNTRKASGKPLRHCGHKGFKNPPKTLPKLR